MKARLAILTMAAALGASACEISADDAPRDIPAGQQSPLGVNSDSGAGASVGTARIYLLLPDEPGGSLHLTSVARDVLDSPERVLTALFAGPNAAESNAQYRTAIPTGTTLHSAVLRGGTLRVDVSEELLQLSGEALVGAVAQIVFTGSELSGVRSVRIVVDGVDQQWPAGNGELRSTALTVYDYPGLVPSAQPSYPAIPSPTEPE